MEKIFKKYGVTAAYLFGSAAKGKMHRESDVDIAVRFSKDLSLKKILLLGNELTALYGKPVDIVDLDHAPLPLQFRVFRERKLLYAKNPKQEAYKRAMSLSLYFDYKYYYDRYRYKKSVPLFLIGTRSI